MLILTKRINVELLHQQLKAALGDAFDGLTYNSAAEEVKLLFFDETQGVLDAARAIADTHDPDALSAAQQAALDAAAREAAADTNAAAIPGWATWDEDTALTWLDDNVTDLASAKVAIKAMARMLLALRDKNWPHLAA